MLQWQDWPRHGPGTAACGLVVRRSRQLWLSQFKFQRVETAAKKGVPPVMHDLIIFRALFSDSIPLRIY